MAKVFYADDDNELLEMIPLLFSEEIELKTHHIKNGTIGDNVKSVAKESDALILDYDWEGTGNGVSFARELRNKGYDKPIIIFSANTIDYIKQEHPDFDTLNLEYASKTINRAALNLQSILEEKIAEYQKQHHDLPPH